MKELAVAAVQMASVLGNAKLNAARMCRWIEHAAASGAQMVFFPECSLTGYRATKTPDLAIAADDDFPRQLEARATALDVAVGYGFVERDDSNGLPFDTYVVALGDDRLVYRKTHLGASECSSFSQGDALPVATVAGVCVGVQLCWESHIPDIAATLRAQGAELLLSPHAVGLGGSRRIELWCRYLAARAQDNGLFVMACNALRFDERWSEGVEICNGWGGGLAAFGPDGVLLNSYCGYDERSMIVHIGGVLPRESSSGGMKNISYYDRRRPELYRT